jgi:hypothetical protein
MGKNTWDIPHLFNAVLTMEKVMLEQKKKEIEEKLIMANKQLEYQLKLLEKADGDGK